MEMDANVLTVNGKRYVLEGTENVKAQSVNGLEYVIVRTRSAGVFAGYLSDKEPEQVVLKSARRLWVWYGAASLSQLAVDGVSRPGDCKFPCELETITLSEWIEIIPTTEKAKKSIASVAVWKA